MMKYVEAPEEYHGRDISLFLAGGITGCLDWQQEMQEGLRGLPVVLLNPRQKNFPIGDPSASIAQIEWEFKYLRRATAISFWFPKETLCPVALFELGAWSMTDKPLFVGVHPEYPRINDIKIQLGLARPDIWVVEKFESVINQVVVWSQMD